MLGNDPAVLADHDAIGISLDLNGSPDCARRHRVFVVILGTDVRINCLYPGIIETETQAKLGADLIVMGVFLDAKSVQEFVLSKTPCGGWASR
jgi:hypothetical protein